MAEELLDTIGQLFGPVRGGLAYAVILVGALLAATTGVVAASVISMGLISLPIMLRYGYDRRLASGVIAASGTLAQIIPPSLVLIVLADQLGQSVGDLYKGALTPALMLTGLYAAYVLVISVVCPSWVPAMPIEARTLGGGHPGSGLGSLVLLLLLSGAVGVVTERALAASRPVDEQIVLAACAGVGLAFVAASLNRTLSLGLLSPLAERVVLALIPPLALVFLVLGTIFLGVATPTEGGALGAVGALALALLRGRMSLLLLRQAMESTTRLSCFVLFILIGSTMFSLTFQAVDGPAWVAHLLSHLPGGALGFLIVINLLVFVLAFFLDFFELAFIVVPLIAPVAAALGIDPVWFGVLLAMNMQTSFMHPPFGFALFYLRSVAPDKAYVDSVSRQRIEPVTTGQIYLGAIPFVLIQLGMVAMIIAFPSLVSTPHAASATPAPLVAPAPTPSSEMGRGASDETASAATPAAPTSTLDSNEIDPLKALQEEIARDAGASAPR
jgi:GntP family gluconate:H+ symporter